MNPRDELELNTLERTGSFDIAEDVGNVVQWLIEMYAEQLSLMMGVPAEELMPDLWEMVDPR